MDPSRVLVLYYSRTGTTRAVAQAIRAELRCDIERICDRTVRSGLLGFLRSVGDGLLGRGAELYPLQRNLRDYDLVIIGGPVWSGRICSPIRSFLDQHRGELDKVAFFCTYLGTGSARALREMSHHAERAPMLTLDVRTTDARSFAIAPKIRSLATALGVATGSKPRMVAQTLRLANEAA